MSAIDDLRVLLKQEEVTYPDLLNILILLEREHAVTAFKVKSGLTGQVQKDMHTALAMGRLAYRIRTKVEKKLIE